MPQAHHELVPENGVDVEESARRALCPRWLNHTFACAAHRCLLDGIPGWRLPGSAVYPRFRPLRTSRRPGGYAVTPAPGGRDLLPHGTLSYKVNNYLAVCPEAEASFRPTGRTSMNAVLICQPQAANTCCTASRGRRPPGGAPAPSAAGVPS